MNADLKAKWVDALRSGKYTQAKYSLRNSEGYCCLGVLCVVAGLPLENDPYSAVNDLLSPADDQPFMLMNDSQGKTFPQIADYIEANL